ncbi:MAG: Hpt domain-containing protein [Treponema sp.]|jgi:two-component system sensor histidine kinase/response regulator|nr:Hpt domain-containing protein [Treponema sp.]
MSDVVLIDPKDALKRVMNNEKLYAKLLNKFKSDNSNIKEMEEALAKGDLEKAKNAVHTIKGLAANLSLVELHKQSLEMESQIKAGSVNPGQFDELKNVFTLTLTEMDKVIAQYE